MEISVIIPTFNYDKYVARAIRSCIEQSFPKDQFEILVINDSSQDSTKYILESYGHWIRTIEHDENMGLPYSRNHGIKMAKGKYIVNLDADDFLNKDFLQICYWHMFYNNCDAVATDYFLVDDNEKFIKRINVYERHIAWGIMFRREQMLNVGLYDTALRIGEDVDFRIRFDRQYRVERVNLPLYRYRMHKKNSTSDRSENLRYLDLISKKHKCRVQHTYHPEQQLDGLQPADQKAQG